MGEEGRAILLAGMMGSGKTSVGRALARRLGCEFIDTDARIEAASGLSIPALFAREGEAGFRKREREVLAALPERACVVALGGGALVAASNREVLRGKGRLVWLDAGPEELARRVGDDPGRPLLAGLSGEARVERLRQLRQERLEAYASAELRVETGGRSIEEVCDALLRALFGAIPPAAGEGDR
jgi:shikimate kinase